MKKILFLVVVFLSTSMFFSQCFAQGFTQDNLLLGGGIGVGGRLGSNGIPFGIHFEKGISDKIGVGAYGGYAAFKGVNSTINYIIVGGRGVYHYGNHLDLADNWDLYGGLNLYYLITRTNGTTSSNPFFSDEPSAGTGSVGLGIFAGAKYYFSEQAGVFVELGTGISWIELGVALRF